MKPYYFILLALTSLGVISCNSTQNQAQLLEEYNEGAPKAISLFEKGKAEEEKGDIRSAAKIYDRLATIYPAYKQSAEASFNAGQHWEKLGEPMKAFESYQQYITTYRSGRNYSSALDRQSAIAFSAAKGELVQSFLGLKTEPDYPEVIGLLQKLRDNAPATDLAARTQFAMGTYSERKDKIEEAVRAYFRLVDTYPRHSLAPEANLRAAKVMAGISERGNQNSSNLKNSRDTLQDLIHQYPNSTQAKEAKTLLSEVDGIDVRRTYDIADFYEKKGKISSARYYYEEVVSKSQSGSHYHNLALDKLNSLQ